MAKKVVQGGALVFKDDLPVREKELVAPLGLLLPAVIPDRLAVLYRGRRFLLQGGPLPDFIRVWGRRYGLAEDAPPSVVEDRFRSAHSKEVSAALVQWLERVLPGICSGPAKSAGGPQVKQVLLDKLATPGPEPFRPPMSRVGAGTVAELKDGSAFARVEGLDRVLFLDGKVYDLLTVSEYIGKFKKAFREQRFEAVVGLAGRQSPEEVVAYMEKHAADVDRKTLHVLKGKLHFDSRTVETFLDGTWFVPELAFGKEKVEVLYRWHWEIALKRDAVENLIP